MRGYGKREAGFKLWGGLPSPCRPLSRSQAQMHRKNCTGPHGSGAMVPAGLLAEV